MCSVAASLRRVPLFADLPEHDLEAVAGLCQEKRFARGAVIFLADDPGEAMFIIREGSVRIYVLSEDGRQKTLDLLGPGEFFGEMAILDDLPRSAYAEAREDAIMLAIAKKDFASLLRSRPELALKIIAVLSRRLRAANAQMEQLVFGDVRARLAATLLELHRRHGLQGGIIGLRLTHQELANLVGAARETVTRLLLEFMDEGILGLAGRHLAIKNRDALAGIAAGRGEES